MKAIVTFPGYVAQDYADQVMDTLNEWAEDPSQRFAVANDAVVTVFDDEWNVVQSVCSHPDIEPVVTTTLESVDLPRDRGLYFAAAIQMLGIAFLIWWVALR